MVLPILGILPAIFTAISGASELFESVRKMVEAVTRAPSAASTPEELEEEIRKLPEDLQTRWAHAMQAEISRYEAETRRLEIAGGRIDSNITSRLSVAAADSIAILRQTTRPWAVRMAMHFILMPFYLAVIDIAQGLILTWFIHPLGALSGADTLRNMEMLGTFKSVFGIDPRSTSDQGLGTTVIGQIYVQTVGWLTGIVVTYMGLREYGKAKGTAGDPAPAPVTAIGRTLAESGTIADQVARVIARVKKAAARV